MTKASIRILVIDPHELMRAGIRLACQSKTDLEVVGEIGQLDQGRQLAAELAPDVLILDLATCDAKELALVHDLHVQFPLTKILVFTSIDGANVASQVIAAGASGYLIKIAGLDEIAVAIQCVHLGRTFISHTKGNRATQPPIPPLDDQAISQPPTESSPVDRCSRRDAPESHGGLTPPKANLSEREREVLVLLAEGLTNKQAAECLYLSVKTIETYRSRIMKKHRLRDRRDLVRFAREIRSGAFISMTTR